MTKLGVQGGTEDEKTEVKQEVVKDPKVFTVVQPTFIPMPIQNSEPMRKTVPSTWCLMARLLALVLVGSLLFSLLVFAVWNKDEVARAITGDKTAHFRTLSEPQFAALNSQAQQQAEAKKVEDEKEGAQITIKQTDEGTQMIVQLPKAAEETKDGAKTTEGAAIPILTLVPSRSEESSQQQDESSEMSDEDRRPMHPYEMEGPSPDALNYGAHPLMALQAARAAQYENEMRAWRMRRLQQMLVMAAVQQAQQREAAMRYAMFQRQQWAAQQMAMQQAFEARRQMEWQEYWRRAAIARAMQQQQQQQAVQSSWQAAEQPRPWWIQQQQQPMMAWPQQQFMQQPQQQFMPPQQQQMNPFWMMQQQQQMQQHMQQQQPQPAFEPQGAQVPASQPLLVFQQQLQQRLRERLQQHLQQQQEMPMQSQSQSSESQSEEQPQPMPQPQPHAFIFIRRFFPIPQDGREAQPASASSEESNEKNIPLRPHDASAQQIVEQMRGGQQQQSALPDAPLPGIHDRIFQHFQSLSQQMQDRSGQSQAQSQPPLFASIPNSIEATSEQTTIHNYDQDAIYEKLQRKAMELQQDAKPASVQVDSHSKEDSALVGEDDHDIRRGDAVLGAKDKSAQVDSDIQTTTEPVMIENFVRAQSQSDEEEKDDEDELTPEEKRKVSQLDSAELKEAAALEASLEREANEAKMNKDEEGRAALAKVEEEIVHDSNKDSSSGSSEEKKEEPEPTTLDPLSEFFRFFENEAVKLSAQDKSGERIVVDSETGTHHPSVLVDEVNDEEENSSEHEIKPDEQLPAISESSKSEEVSASIDTAPVSNEAEIKVSQVANSREIPPITIAAAA
ncbi:hypothetical protein PENTCL1PPCAC_10098 [Pristionchus entomophagus]|uniref:Uncharacterized protein n=1 Tax=Pristionchus entomophagus TaxID=358040 RepID=A0AAV5T129_9BILA|nr:hypothetical protein PENTCL1PPCAC_10098 [Pristionchus entomophagus]